MREVSASFLKRLKEYDSCLGAHFDDVTDSVYIWAVRQGQKIHELTVKREFGENYGELEDRIIHVVLPEKDVWRRFGQDGNLNKAGLKFDDYLHEKEMTRRAQLKKENRSRRLTAMKEHRWEWMAAIKNAQSGRFTKDKVVPFEIPQVSMYQAPEKSKKPFTVTDKRAAKQGAAQK